MEVRSLDLCLFDPVGISQNTMRFMEAFIVYCLLCPSERFDERDWEEIGENQARTAKFGRDPDLRLQRNGSAVSLRQWAAELLDGIESVAALIDRGSDRDDYRQSIGVQRELVEDAERTPSARILADLREQQTGFFRFALRCAERHKEYFASLAPLSAERHEMFVAEAKGSLQRQAEIEAQDEITFEEYLARYYAS